MINISFDNPYLLLLLIPLALLVIIPFAIAIRRENKSRETTIALICHLLIVALVTLAVAGMKHTTVITETELYVLADVSHSTSERLELIDGHIEALKDQLPRNSKMGVITFGKDVKLHTELGGELTSIKDSGTDTGATDILSALKFADSLYRDSTIKRLVLYTDGLSTDPEVNGELARTVADMKERDVYIDVVYIDSNLSEDAKELQISDVEFNASTYLEHETTANILVESTVETDVIVKLRKNQETYLEKAVHVTPGFNIVNMDLYTEQAGEFDYELSIAPLEDTSSYNNLFAFTQKVNETVSVLLVTAEKADVEIVQALYGERAVIDAYVKPPEPTKYGVVPEPFDVPFTVEELCKYDEYILSNVNVEDINNADSFVSSIDTCVSMFGKSLITAGNNDLQNSEAASVDALSNMLPVRFGNDAQDTKLYAIVIDSSRSMEFKNFDFFRMAKTAAKYLLGFLNEGDYFTIVHFSGEVYVPMLPQQVTPANIEKANALIDGLTVTQGTMIGQTLERVNELLSEYDFCEKKQVMLISDGMSFEGGELLQDDPIAAALALKNNNVTVSALNAGNDEGIATMQAIAAAGGGSYYFAKSSDDLVGVMFDEIADDVTETLVRGTADVIINKANDKVLSGVETIPPINCYVYAKAKASAENVLFVEYQKASGKVKVPLYSYWNYGKGRVSTLTTALGGEWVSGWQAGEGAEFLQNIYTENVPATKIDYPYTVEVTFDGKYTHLEIVPAVLNPDATMTVTVTLPDGSTQTEKLIFDSYRYFYKFETGLNGKYRIDASYDWTTKSYSSSNVFNLSYSPEYDSFNSFSPAALHAFVRNNGTVTESGNVTLKAEEVELDTYVIRFTVPFLAAAAALYIVDTVIRKLKWADIKSFFKRKRKKEAVK